MGVNDPNLGIPALRENPFQARPLEPGQSNLLVGRGDISARWVSFLNQKNARMVLLVGESGSGRTSLMRCASEESGSHVHIDMFPSENPVRGILEEIFALLVGFNIPSSNQELVGMLVNSTANVNGPLPLISLDFSSTDGRILAEVTSNLISALERLEALVVITLTTDQRMQWPESLVQKFDHLEVLHPLNNDDVKQLCELRMATASRTGWNASDELVDYLSERTGGNPLKIMRTMRDLVDYERNNPREVKFETTDIEIREIESDENSSKTIDEDMIEAENDEEIIENSDFELDFDLLAKDPPNVIRSEPQMISVRGAFGGLASRNRDYSRENPPPVFKQQKQIQDEGPENELWMADGSEPVLMQQESMDEGHYEMDYEDNLVVENNIEKLPESTEITEFIGEIVRSVSSLPKGMSLSDLLAAMRRPIIGHKLSNTLDVHTLRNLSKSEAVIVEVSSIREFSPSDNRLQDRLGIKRPRMSQICNHLYRAGILSVQQKGRERKFKLTNDAKAQLVAWGMMEAVV